MKKLLLSFALLISLTFITPALAGWQPPTLAPTGNNADAPINVSVAGQTKNGGLGILGLLATASNFFVGLTTLHPNVNLLDDVGYPAFVAQFNGNVGADKYCDVTGNNCLTITQMGNASSTGGGGGVYVGATSSGGPNSNGTYDGSQVGGYDGGDTKCNVAFPGSRMATAADFANKRPADSGWYSSFVQHPGSLLNDCGNWAVNLSTWLGSFWNGSPAAQYCSSAYKILCSMPGAATGGGGTTTTGITSLTAGTGITLNPNPITTTGTIAASDNGLVDVAIARYQLSGGATVNNVAGLMAVVKSGVVYVRTMINSSSDNMSESNWNSWKSFGAPSEAGASIVGISVAMPHGSASAQPSRHDAAIITARMSSGNVWVRTYSGFSTINDLAYWSDWANFSSP